MKAGAIVRELAALGPEALRALVAWLDGDSAQVAPEAFAELPETLRSQIELELMEARAAQETKT